MPGAPKKVRGLWPLPGGVESYFDTALVLLDEIRSKSPAEDQLAEFIKSRFNAYGNASIPQYIRVLRTLGLVEKINDRLGLTSRGTDVLESRDPVRMFQALEERVLGIREILQFLAATPLSLEQIRERLQVALEVSWETSNQTFFRTCWLRSLELITKAQAGDFSLTSRGRSVLEALSSGPVIAPPSPPAPERDSSPLPNRSLDLCQRLQDAAVAGGDGRDFELCVAEAFGELGFEIRHVGGPSEPDVILDARRGIQAFRAILDAKSSSKGVVQEQQINWDSILEHLERAKAQVAILVGPEFAGGNLETRAQKKKIRLLRVSQLAALLEAHRQSPLGFDDIIAVLNGAGSMFEEDLEKLARIAEDASIWLRIVGDVYNAVWNRQSERRAKLDVNSLFFLLEGEYEGEQIEKAVDFLSSPIVRAIDRDGEGRLRTTCAPQTVAERLHKLMQTLLSPSLGT